MVNLFDFQEEAVSKLIEKTSFDKNTIVVKSPTGSGKTIMLIEYINRYLSYVSENVAFIWFCPGKGDLEEQSLNKMKKIAPHLKGQTLSDGLLGGFQRGSTTFINWEKINNKKNVAIRDSEGKNIYDRIAEAHRSNIKFIIIIDEEHANKKAQLSNPIISAFSADIEIRVSATTLKNSRHDYIEINEIDVINSGLITRAVYINEDIVDNEIIENEIDFLIDKADKKRKLIAQEYANIGKNIRPLVLIQFPSAREETIKYVEEKLYSLGYTYENGLIAKWLSDDKKNLEEDISRNDGLAVFLLMKQAISTGWDCPRAKILVKLRENMNETFTIQTIGRIRRMPEARHYNNTLLDNSFIYTMDEKFKQDIFSNIDKAYEVRRLILKKEHENFRIKKESKNDDINYIGTQEIFNTVYNYYIKEYKLSENKKENQVKLENNGYVFSKSIDKKIVKDKFETLDKIAENKEYYHISEEINTHSHGLDLLSVTNELKKIVGVTREEIKAVLVRLFIKSKKRDRKQILSLEKKEFYGFIINNKDRLKEDFRKISSSFTKYYPLMDTTKISEFKLPKEEVYKYDVSVKDEINYLKNTYEYYSSGYATSKVRSTSEYLFEDYCENSDEVKWIYKNGDSGSQYLSIVYTNGFNVQCLFYPDYILEKVDGSIWIIETKGGESGGINKNIDIQVENKFDAFKDYSKSNNINWAFVRDKDGKLYYNNEEYSEEMSNENWKSIKEIL